MGVVFVSMSASSLRIVSDRFWKRYEGHRGLKSSLHPAPLLRSTGDHADLVWGVLIRTKLS